MLLKIIKCSVENEQKKAFSKAQEGWSAIAGINGFVKQLGGWHAKKTNQAQIFAFWQDVKTYDDFMKNHHDDIYHTLNQKSTYSSSTLEFQEGNIDYLHWYIEQQNIKIEPLWDIKIDSLKTFLS